MPASPARAAWCCAARRSSGRCVTWCRAGRWVRRWRRCSGTTSTSPSRGTYASQWRADVAQAGGGCLIEHSIHDVDILRFCFGEVDSVVGPDGEPRRPPGHRGPGRRHAVLRLGLRGAAHQRLARHLEPRLDAPARGVLPRGHGVARRRVPRPAPRADQRGHRGPGLPVAALGRRAAAGRRRGRPGRARLRRGRPRLRRRGDRRPAARARARRRPGGPPPGRRRLPLRRRRGSADRRVPRLKDEFGAGAPHPEVGVAARNMPAEQARTIRRGRPEGGWTAGYHEPRRRRSRRRSTFSRRTPTTQGDDPERALAAPRLHPAAAGGEGARGHRAVLGDQDLDDGGRRGHLGHVRQQQGARRRRRGLHVRASRSSLQFASRRYSAIPYWFLALAIATAGTGVADTMHLVLGMPYAVTTLFWLVVLAVVFFLWNRSEHTLDIHSITTSRREKFYWAVVFATFALGTAVGDFTATTLGLGLPGLGAPLLRRHPDPVGRLEVPQLEQHLLLLVRLRDHPARRGLVRRLPQQGPRHQRRSASATGRRRCVSDLRRRGPGGLHGDGPLRHPVARRRDRRTEPEPAPGRGGVSRHRVRRRPWVRKVRPMDIASLLLELYGRIPPLAAGGGRRSRRGAALRRPPNRAPTPIGWLVWHLARVQDHHVAELLGTEQIWVSGDWARRCGLEPDPSNTGYGHGAEEVARRAARGPRRAPRLPRRGATPARRRCSRACSRRPRPGGRPPLGPAGHPRRAPGQHRRRLPAALGQAAYVRGLLGY